MQIEDPCVVTLTWALDDAQNRPIDRLDDPAEFFFGGDDLLPRVQQALAGHVPGETVRVQLEPEHAFGDYEAALVCFEPRRIFPERLEPGMTFEGLPAGHTSEGMPRERVYVVTEVYPEHVVLDGNHPLAGLALRLTLTVRGVRHASADELAARSVGRASALTVLAGRGGSAGGSDGPTPPLH